MSDSVHRIGNGMQAISGPPMKKITSPHAVTSVAAAGPDGDLTPEECAKAERKARIRMKLKEAAHKVVQQERERLEREDPDHLHHAKPKLTLQEVVKQAVEANKTKKRMTMESRQTHVDNIRNAVLRNSGALGSDDNQLNKRRTSLTSLEIVAENTTVEDNIASKSFTEVRVLPFHREKSPPLSLPLLYISLSLTLPPPPPFPLHFCHAVPSPKHAETLVHYINGQRVYHQVEHFRASSRRLQCGGSSV
jgi:hypothetical protein